MDDDRQDWEEMLREALIADPRSRHEIGQISGVQPIKLWKFQRREKTLNIQSACALGHVLGFTLKPPKGKAR